MASLGQVFVSHSHEDNNWCRAFVDELRNLGADVWYDEHNLGYGVLREEIERELLARPVFIVILSPAGIASKWVRRELDAAIHLQDQESSRVILPVVAQTCSVPLMLVGYKRISGIGDTGLSPSEAAGRAAGLFSLRATSSPQQASPIQATGTMILAAPASSSVPSITSTSEPLPTTKRVPPPRIFVHADTDLYDEEQRRAAIKYPRWLQVMLAGSGIVTIAAAGFIDPQPFGWLRFLFLTVWLYALEVVLIASIFRAPAMRNRRILLLGWSAASLATAALISPYYSSLLQPLKVWESPWTYTLLDLGALIAFWAASVPRWLRAFNRLQRKSAQESGSTTSQVGAQLAGGLIASGVLAALLALLIRAEVINPIADALRTGTNITTCTVSWPIGNCVGGGGLSDPMTLSRLDLIVALAFGILGLLSAGMVVVAAPNRGREISTALISGVRRIMWPGLMVGAAYGIVQLGSTVVDYLDLDFKSFDTVLYISLLVWGVLATAGILGTSAILAHSWRVVTNSARYLWSLVVYIFPKLWILSLALWALNVLLEQFNPNVMRPFDPPSWVTAASLLTILILGLSSILRRTGGRNKAASR